MVGPDWTAVRRALQISDRPWAVVPAIRAAVAVGTCAAIGAVLGNLTALGLMYFGAACAVVFVTAGVYRTRAVALASQGLGVTAGFGLGSLAGSTPTKVAVAAAVALVCGAVGAIGPMVTAGALMTVIGTSYAQFSGLAMPWWQLALWYLAGTAIVSIPALLPWLTRRERHERAAVAAVFVAAADLLEAVGTSAAPSRRATLAAASAAARAAVLDHRLGTGAPRNGLIADFSASQQAALQAARHYAEARPVSTELIHAMRRDGDQVRSGATTGAIAAVPWPVAPWPVAPWPVDPWYRRIVPALRVARGRSAMLAGVRLAWCMSLATLTAAGLHGQSHSYWLPLTVAVVVRPEYASVFVRTVNRVAGTLTGALVAMVALLILDSGWSVALVAALSTSFAVLAVPKLYGLSVVGVTTAALLSACIGATDPTFPVLRLTDTMIGCAIAVVFGYVLWPGRHNLPDGVRLAATARLAVGYLGQAVKPAPDRRGWPAVRDDAYRSAHQTRAATFAALADPRPVGDLAAAALPVAIALEDTVDGISALSAEIDGGWSGPTEDERQSLAELIIATGARSSDPLGELPAHRIRSMLAI